MLCYLSRDWRQFLIRMLINLSILMSEILLFTYIVDRKIQRILYVMFVF